MGQLAECIGGEFLMADYLVTDKDLILVADAIRTKSGTREPMAWPDGYKETVESIPSGGGGAKEPYVEETYDANGNLIDVNLVGYTVIRPYAFINCTSLALTSLPNTITRIGSQAFYGCTSLALTSLPSGLISIGNSAFDSCTGLTTITFHGKTRSIAPNAFNGCTNLKTINVPWEIGEVAGAPWGATNATINYNYTG